MSVSNFVRCTQKIVLRTMISIRFAIHIYLCLTIKSKAQAQGISAPTEDLVDEYYTFGSPANENIIFYLRRFFKDRNETMITIALVLTKDMQAMIKKYDNVYPVSFKTRRKAQKQPYENMLRVWVRHNRDAIEKEELNHHDVVNDANTLKKEHDSGHWHQKCRDQLELILMKKSIKYSRAVMTHFETIMGNKTTESIINDSKQTWKLNPDLADAYSSLAIYIKDKYNYIADTLSKHSECSDPWDVWFLCDAVLHPQEWSKVDLAFRNLKDHKDESLTKFIMRKRTDDKETVDLMVAIINPKPKPTHAQNGSGGVQPTSPPISPTTQAPVLTPASVPASPR